MLELNVLTGFGLGLIIGAGVMKWVGGSQKLEMRKLAEEMTNQVQTERIRDLEKVIEQLKESFSAISYQALAQNSDQFLAIANQALKYQTQLGEQSLDNKKQLIDRTLEQLGREIGKVHEVIGGLEKDRERKFGELSNQLKSAAEATGHLRETTDHLRSALANSRVRGQWGERMAEDVLRMSGLIEGVNYRKQQGTAGGGRPDYTFYLPKDLKVNMDVKFPLENYLHFVQAGEAAVKEGYKQQFLKDVRSRIKEVTGRDYINPEEHTVDFVLVFIPNEQIYGFIHDADGSLLDDALRNRVVLCSPLTLYAYLAVIRQAVENYNLEQTTSRVLSLLGSFYKQWENFCGGLERMGRKLNEAQKEYASLVTTRRSQLEKPLQLLEELRKQNNLPVEQPAIPETAATQTQCTMDN
jgi:DNA recombination protein RmuC